MCACTETDVRESANDCTLASGEGHDSRGETYQPLYAAKPVSSSVERTVVPGIVLGVKGRPLCKADNFTAICEPIV
jgi:hypothetical protein